MTFKLLLEQYEGNLLAAYREPVLAPNKDEVLRELSDMINNIEHGISDIVNCEDKNQVLSVLKDAKTIIKELK